MIFAVARNADGVAIGCGAIVNYDNYGEIKRMYVLPRARGQGVARQIIEMLELKAYAQGRRKFLLETGPYQSEALGFYTRQGYRECGAFGDYPEHPLSVFMVKLFE